LLTAEFNFDMETVGLWDVVVTLENENELLLPEGLELTESVDVHDPTSQDLIVYPNPANTILNITLPQEANLLTIYDALGKQVLWILPTTQISSLDVSSLSSGTYFIMATLKDQMVIERFQIAR
jgi:hypothetical protein